MMIHLIRDNLQYDSTKSITAENTSATKRVSSSLREQEAAKAPIRSLSVPLFGTVTVIAEGNVTPSVLMTVTVIVRVVVEGNGRDRYIKGSKVIETLLQKGQINVDRN